MNFYTTTVVSLTVSGLLMLGSSGCSSPKPLAPELEQQEVQKMQTQYSSSVLELGHLSDMFASGPLYVQTKGVVDDTGISKSMSNMGEIPYDITEMIKSAVNKAGGGITLIDYDPSHQSNMMALGYTQFDQKIKPDLVISGGITEYDRALQTEKEGVNLDVEHGNVGLGAAYDQARSVDRITIDINLIRFDTWAMIPQMNATNSIKVYMGSNTANIGFSILSNVFGLNGSVKEIQGRHAAVRMLVEMSVVEVLGRYLNLPYWKVLPNGQEDPVVMQNVRKHFMSNSESGRVAMIQMMLFLHGYDMTVDGTLNTDTKNAVDDYGLKNKLDVVGINRALFEHLFLNVPITNNFRTAPVFASFKDSYKVANNSQSQNIATPAQAASANVATTPEDLVSFQEVLSDKKITASGIFIHKNEMIAKQMATNIALNNLAKKVGNVLQEESTVLNNDKMELLIKTNAKNVIKGYEIISQKYDKTSGRAEVNLQLEGSVLAGQVEALLNRE
ncbi:MAG: hypothetical protein JXK05_08175 [Campylobacterales bacterium]|nr:hypothetical protein [Campylobacterales bacterium]